MRKFYVCKYCYSKNRLRSDEEPLRGEKVIGEESDELFMPFIVAGLLAGILVPYGILGMVGDILVMSGIVGAGIGGLVGTILDARDARSVREFNEHIETDRIK